MDENPAAMPTLTGTQLKILAICVMFLDHFVDVIMPHEGLAEMILRTPGRVAAPIMCYMIAEGYAHTSSRARYLRRLFLFAAVSHIPYVLCFDMDFFQSTSVMWTLAMGLLALMVWKENRIPGPLRLLSLMGCCALAYHANWNYVGVLWVVVFGVFHGDRRKQFLCFALIGLLFHVLPTFMDFGFSHDGYPHWYQLGIFLAIPLLWMYRGERGRSSRFMSWFFYVFYPAHFVLIYILKQGVTFFFC